MKTGENQMDEREESHFLEEALAQETSAQPQLHEAIEEAWITLFKADAFLRRNGSQPQPREAYLDLTILARKEGSR